jgi:hypothetical protein
MLDTSWCHTKHGMFVPCVTIACHRTPDDVLLAAAYQWYASQYQPGSHPTLPDAHSSFLAINDPTSRSWMPAALEDLRTRQRANDTTADVIVTSMEFQTGGYTKQLSMAAAAAAEQAASGQFGQHLATRASMLQYSLRKAWTKSGAKLVCLQDDLSDGYADARQLIDPIVRRLLASEYPAPSQFEVPEGTSNGCR